ncbi:substrate-binding domain-containing protein [Streptomyces longisporus]|uniref:substrate-binding domain-containing protein n=1 Tax=Streptomyces longisporus TaxID=1948 RepID=UPI0031CDC6CA
MPRTAPRRTPGSRPRGAADRRWHCRPPWRSGVAYGRHRRPLRAGHNILAAARQHRLRVPRDLLVACVSEDPDYATTTPPVTTVSLCPDQVGAEAVDLLIAVINARSGVDRRRLVQPILTPRRSTRHPTP